MTGALWLSLLVAAGPPRVALMTGSRVGVGEKEAAQLSARLGNELKAAGLSVLEVSLPCRGEYACLQEQGRALDVEAVVSLTLASGPRQVAIDAETVSVRTASSLDQRSISWKNKQPLESLDPLLRECAVQIAARVLAARPPDAPTQVALTPSLPVEALPVVVLKPPPVSRAPELVTGGLTLALGIAAGVLTGVAADQQARLAAEPPFTLTREQAVQRRDTANGTYTAAAASGGVAGALALTALTLWLVR